MTSYITGAASLVEPVPDELFDYKIRCSSDSLYFADASPYLPRTYTQPNHNNAYLSLLEEQQAQHMQWLKTVRKVVSMYFEKQTHWKSDRRKQRKGQSSKRWSASCRRIVCGGSGLQTMRRPYMLWILKLTGVCLTGLIAVESPTYIAARCRSVVSILCHY